ncbi:MAG: mechanosensitive ion channel [Bacteroidia bacterium]|nr:mechanosensitive ion channel [Bacteroidia bacterium]
MEDLTRAFDSLRTWLNVPLFTVGNVTLTLWTIVYLLILLVLLYWITSKLTKVIVYKLLANSRIELGTRVAVGSILRYTLLTIGFIVILQTAGINLSSLTILLGALGVGIGFGLQNITNNFVSGLIILFERPIKVGDRIEVSGIAGNVVDISMRATTIITNDNISIIVPNSEFISGTVINWSHTSRNVRFSFPVGVAYKEDPEQIRRILLDVALATDGVLREPKPDVLFKEYGDSSINFDLRVWTSEYTDRPGVLKSILYYEIWKQFKRNGIEIPFPQRDLYIRQMPGGREGQEEAADD